MDGYRSQRFKLMLCLSALDHHEFSACRCFQVGSSSSRWNLRGHRSDQSEGGANNHTQVDVIEWEGHGSRKEREEEGQDKTGSDDKNNMGLDRLPRP